MISDSIIKKDILELFKINFKNNYLLAVKEPCFSEHNRLKMDPKSDYFNSGVMLINLKKWRNENIPRKTLNFVLKNGERIKFVDQCGLNAIIDGKWKKISPEYNQQTIFFKKNLKDEFPKYTELERAKKDPRIIHYTGSSKPWRLKNCHPYKYIYWKYYLKSPYVNILSYPYAFINILLGLTINYKNKLKQLLLRKNKK